MNQPYPDFVRSQEKDRAKRPWGHDRYASVIVLFGLGLVDHEYDLETAIQKWRQNEGLSNYFGRIHFVEVPGTSQVKLKAWTMYQGFHHRNPLANDSTAPQRLLYFREREDLVRWIGANIPKGRAGIPFSVFPRLYGPNEEMLPGYILTL